MGCFGERDSIHLAPQSILRRLSSKLLLYCGARLGEICHFANSLSRYGGQWAIESFLEFRILALFLIPIRSFPMGDRGNFLNRTTVRI